MLREEVLGQVKVLHVERDVEDRGIVEGGRPEGGRGGRLGGRGGRDVLIKGRRGLGPENVYDTLVVMQHLTQGLIQVPWDPPPPEHVHVIKFLKKCRGM